jgi:aspartate racemase
MENKFQMLGILGGMGPWATIAFMRKLIELTPAKRDWDHIHSVVDFDVTIPSRSRHVLYNETSPVPGMMEACLRLEQYGVDAIAIPCNSASFFIPEFSANIKVPLLNIIDVTVSCITPKLKGKKCAVIGGAVTYNKYAYKRYLESNGIEFIQHSNSAQRVSESLIEEIKLKGSKFSGYRLSDFIDLVLDETKADAVILGCTEFGCIDLVGFHDVVYDSSAILAHKIVQMFKGEQ